MCTRIASRWVAGCNNRAQAPSCDAVELAITLRASRGSNTLSSYTQTQRSCYRRIYASSSCRRSGLINLHLHCFTDAKSLCCLVGRGYRGHGSRAVVPRSPPQNLARLIWTVIWTVTNPQQILGSYYPDRKQALLKRCRRHDNAMISSRTRHYGGIAICGMQMSHLPSQIRGQRYRKAVRTHQPCV